MPCGEYPGERGGGGAAIRAWLTPGADFEPAEPEHVSGCGRWHPATLVGFVVAPERCLVVAAKRLVAVAGHAGTSWGTGFSAGAGSAAGASSGTRMISFSTSPMFPA